MCVTSFLWRPQQQIATFFHKPPKQALKLCPLNSTFYVYHKQMLTGLPAAVISTASILLYPVLESWDSSNCKLPTASGCKSKNYIYTVPDFKYSKRTFILFPGMKISLSVLNNNWILTPESKLIMQSAIRLVSDLVNKTGKMPHPIHYKSQALLHCKISTPKNFICK